MKRTYEIHKTATGWQLLVLEEGKELARELAEATDQGYAHLLDQAEKTYGIKKKAVRATWWRI